jgi:hypothetical protein
MKIVERSSATLKNKTKGVEDIAKLIQPSIEESKQVSKKNILETAIKTTPLI